MQVVYHVAVHYISNQPLLVILDKRCSACLQFKPLTEYHADKIQQDRMKAVCKECRMNPSVRTFNSQRFLSDEKKICTKCLQEKSSDEFDRCQKTSDGYHGQCKECRSEYNRQFRQENIEHIQEYDRSRIGDPKRKEMHRRRYREAYSIDLEYIRKKKEARRAYYLADPLRAKEQCLKRLARKRDATTEKVNLKHILERDGFFCYICQQPILPHQNLDFDHVIPLQPRIGEPQGTHSASNIKPAHECCNIRKSNLPFVALTEWHKRGPNA